MDKQQFLTLVAILKSNYPNWKFDINDKNVLTAWYDQLNDIPYDIAQLGVKKLLASEEFYPNIAKIRKACASITAPRATDSAEGWGLVMRSISRYGYMRADEAVASLPKDVGQAVLNMGGFQAICESENIEAIRAHFMRSLEQVTNKMKSESVLSIDLKQAIEKYQLENGNAMLIEEVINRKPMLEIDTTEIIKGEAETIGDVLRRELGGLHDI